MPGTDDDLESGPFKTLGEAVKDAKAHADPDERAKIFVCRGEICPHGGGPPASGEPCDTCFVIDPNDRRPLEVILAEMERRN